MKHTVRVLFTIFVVSIYLFLPISTKGATTASLSAVPHPTQLEESNLDGSVIELDLSGTDFMQGPVLSTTSNYILNNAPAGTSISKATGDSFSTKTAYIFLAYNGTGFNSDITNFSVTILPATNQAGVTLTSNAMTIKADVIAGQLNYGVTGAANPASLDISGFNNRTKTIYLNYVLQTTQSVGATQKATYSYYIQIYDQNGNLLGNLGTYANPLSITGAAGSQTLSVANTAITLSSNLPAQFRIILNVKAVSVN